MIHRIAAIVLLIGLLFLVNAPVNAPLSAAPSAVADSAANANDLARQVLMNEVAAEVQDHSYWMCRLEWESSNGRETDELVETKSGNLKRRVLVNGRPPTASEKQEDDQRIKRFVSDPEELRSSMKKQNHDAEQSRKLLKLMPEALEFTFGKRDGDLVELHFTSRPNFRPPSHEAAILQALEGDLWINSKQARLAEISSHLSRDVKFGGGVLGHLKRGGELHVKQAEVAPGYWELTLLNVNMHGKALFFKTINVQQNMRRSDFRQISGDLSLAQAADLLQKRVTVAQTAPPRSAQ